MGNTFSTPPSPQPALEETKAPPGYLDPPSYNNTSDSKPGPPPYVTAEDIEVLELSITATMSELTPEQIQDRIIAGLSSDGADEPLLEDMSKLGRDAWSIDTSFLKIEALFKDVPTQGFSDSWKMDVADLATRWKSHRNAYRSLVTQSIRVAGQAQAAADEFAEDFVDFLSNTNIPNIDKKNEIREYIGKLNRNEGKAQNMIDEFRTLRDNVNEFALDWQKVIDKHKKEKLTYLEQLDEHIEKLTGTLAKLQEKIGKMTAALGVVGGIGMLCFYSPAFWIGAVVGVAVSGVTSVVLIRAVDQRRAANKELNRKMLERAANENAVQALQASMESGKAELSTICDKLITFGTVWATIRGDLQAIEEKLDTVTDTSSQELFQARLATARRVYGKLGKALRHYQIVASAGPLEKTTY